MNDKHQIKEKEDMKIYHIPVNWIVSDKIRVKAHSVDEPEYIDGTFIVEDGENGDASFEDTMDYLKEYWNLSGGIDGTDDEADYVVGCDF